MKKYIGIENIMYVAYEGYTWRGSIDNTLNILTYLLRGTTALTGTSRRLYGFLAWFSVFEDQVANLLPQHRFESAWFNNQSHLVAKQENHGWETGQKIWPTKHLTHAV
jgi:hypothetical protein